MTIILKDIDKEEAWQSAGGPPTPPGRHPAKIESVEEGVAGTGSPQLTITWSVVGGPAQGSQIREWLVVLPQTYGKLKALLEATGWEIPSGEWELPVDKMAGRQATIVVGNEVFNGKESLRVLGHLPFADAAATEMSPERRADAAALPF